MDFDFSDDEQQLRDAVRRWVERGYTFDRHRAIERAGGFDEAAWRELAELGLMGVAIPEAEGGLGMGPVAAMVALEELGAGLVVEPVAAVSRVAATLLAAAPADARGDWLARVAAGDARVVLAHQERRSRYRLDRVEATARASGDGWVVTGAKSLVPVGDRADAFLVPVRVSGAVDDPAGIALCLVERDAPGVTARGYVIQDGSRAAEVTFTDAPAARLLDAGAAFPALEHAWDVGIASACAEGVGAMERLFAMTVEYLNTRRQFGVPIGTFQALRHRVADMKMQLELARSMSYYVTLKLDEAPEVRRRAAAQAKVQLGRSMRFVGQQAVQLHGGIGVTEEYAGSHYFRKLTTLELQFGDTMSALGDVSDRMQDTAGVFA